MITPEPVQNKPAPLIPWHPIVALLFVIVLYFLAPIIGGLLVSIYPLARGWSAQMTNDWLNDSVYAQFCYVVLAEALTLGAIVFFLRAQKRRLADIGLKKPRFKDIGAGILAYPVYFLLFAIMVVLVSKFVPSVNINQQQELGFNNVHGVAPLVLTFISLVVLPPLVEEIMVRGFLFTSLRKSLKLVPAMLITSLAFASAHLPEGGAAGPLYIAAIDTFMLSLVLCFVREKTGSLWAGMTLHALKNGVAYVSLFILTAR